MIHLRSSGLPLSFICPGSARPASLLVDEHNDAAETGSAAHTALRSLVELGMVDWDALPGLALAHGVELDELRMLCSIALKLWPAIEASFPDAITEVYLRAPLDEDGSVLSGHIDALSLAQTVARFLDWKTGRKDKDYHAQLMGYAALVLENHREVEHVTGTIVWVRSSEIENYTVSRAQGDAWLERVRAEVVRWDGAYHPGVHCEWCPRSHECSAANALARRDVAAFMDAGIDEAVGLMAPEQAIEMTEKTYQIERMAKRVRQAIKDRVQQRGDIVGGGKRLTVVTERKRKLDVLKAWPVLEDAGFGNAEFARCIKLSVTAVEKVAAETAGRGNGAAAVRKLKAALETADAVEVEEDSRLMIKREGT